MAAITTAAIGLATAGYSIYSGEKQKSDAKKAMENLEVPELKNPYESMRVSTAGSDLIREEGHRRTANVIEGLQGSGARNMLSAIPRLVAMNNRINQQAMREIDNQIQKRNYAIAGYEEKRNSYEEQRYNNELAGYGNMYDVGQNMVWNGIRTGVSSVGSLARGIDNMPNVSSNNGYSEGMFDVGGYEFNDFNIPEISF